MPYNPSVNDRSGEILAQGMVGAAQAQMQGKMAMGQGIQQGVGSLIDGVVGGIGAYQQAKYKSDFTNGQIDFLAKSGVIAPEEAAKLMEAPQGKKDSAVVTGMAKFDLLNQVQQEQRRDASRDAYLNKSTQAAANLHIFKEGAQSQQQVYAPSQDEIQRMTGAGYIWDQAAGKWVTDRSKFQSGGLMGQMQGLMNPPTGGSPAPSAMATGGAQAPAAPAGGAAPAGQFQEGRIYVQNGVRYRYENGQFVRVP